MAREIQRYPVGFGDLFQLKEGLVATRLSDELVPTAEVAELYLLNGRTSIVSAAIAAVLGGIAFVDLIVPGGELWYVWSFHVGSSVAPLGAGTELELRTNYSLAVNRFVPGPSSGRKVAGQACIAEAVRGFWMPPGAQFGAYCETVVGAPNVVGVVTYTPLRV